MSERLNTPEINEVNHFDAQYHNLLEKILNEGVIEKNERTGVGTIKIFGHMMEFDLSKGFPVITTKYIHTKSIFRELLWFIDGGTNIKDLNKHGVTIWDEWADDEGELGPIYGSQWRSWKTADGSTVDQLSEVVKKIKTEPADRRLIISAWNVGEIDKMALPPCHLLSHFSVANDELSCLMYQRSADTFLGVPFNIASYSLFTVMMAQATGFKPGKFIHVLGDTHLYLNHTEQARLQLSRPSFPPPTMSLNSEVTSITDFKYEDFELVDYQYHSKIPAPIAV